MSVFSIVAILISSLVCVRASVLDCDGVIRVKLSG